MAGRGDIKAGRAFVELFLKNNIMKGLSAARMQLQKFGDFVAGLGRSLLTTGTLVTSIGTIMAAAFIQPIQAAGDMMETVSKFGSVFADQTDGMTEFADEFRKAVGRSKQDVYSGLATFQAFFQGLNFGGKEAAGFSKEMTKLAVDFASFHNLQDPEAMQRFISALSGSGEVLSMFGVNIMEAALNTKLLAMGFPSIAKGATEAQKVLARMSIIKETMGRQGAVGDAIKTAGSFSNQMKALKASISDTAVTLGDALLPVITPLVTQAAKIVKAFAEWALVNGDMIRSAAKFAVSVFAGGVAITAIGAALVAAGVAIKVVAIGLGLILTPLGLITTGLVAGVTSWAMWTDSGKAAVSSVGKLFGDLKGIFGETWQGIVDAIAGGDFAAAGEVAVAGLMLAFHTATQDINKLWLDAKWWFLTVWEEAKTGLAKVFVSAWAGLQSGFEGAIAIMRTVWNAFSRYVGDTFDIGTSMVMDNLVGIANQLGYLSDIEAATLHDLNNKAVVASVGKRGQDSTARQNEIDTQLRDRLATIDSDESGALGILDQEKRRARAEIDAQHKQGINDKQAALDAARARLTAAKGTASESRAMAEYKALEAKYIGKGRTFDDPVDAAKQAAIGAGKTMGSFSAAGLIAQANGGGMQAQMLAEQRKARQEAKQGNAAMVAKLDAQIKATEKIQLQTVG